MEQERIIGLENAKKLSEDGKVRTWCVLMYETYVQKCHINATSYEEAVRILEDKCKEGKVDFSKAESDECWHRFFGVYPDKIMENDFEIINEV